VYFLQQLAGERPVLMLVVVGGAARTIPGMQVIDQPLNMVHEHYVYPLSLYGRQAADIFYFCLCHVRLQAVLVPGVG